MSDRSIFAANVQGAPLKWPGSRRRRSMAKSVTRAVDINNSLIPTLSVLDCTSDAFRDILIRSECRVLQGQTAVASYFSSKQLLLSDFARQCYCSLVVYSMI